MKKEYICNKCKTQYHSWQVFPTCCGSRTNVREMKQVEKDWFWHPEEGVSSLKLNSDQQKRVDEQNEMNDQFLIKRSFESRSELEKKLKELGIKNVNVQVDRMEENTIEYIITGKTKYRANKVSHKEEKA